MRIFKAALKIWYLAAVYAFLGSFTTPLSARLRQPAGAHIPAAGSAERKAITDGLRGEQKVSFKIHYLKVHGDWAWIDVTPLDEKGKPVAEGHVTYA